MDEYYEPHALLTLERHLVLAGPLAFDTRRIGHRLASQLGLSFIDLDRRIEHRAGMSLWQLARQEGTAAVRRREVLELRRGMDDRPYGVVVLGDGALIDDDSRARVLREGRLIVLDYELANAYWRLKTHAERHEGRWHPLDPAPLERIDQVRSFLDRRRAGFAAGEHLSVTGQRLGPLLRSLETKLVS